MGLEKLGGILHLHQSLGHSREQKTPPFRVSLQIRGNPGAHFHLVDRALTYISLSETWTSKSWYTWTQAVTQLNQNDLVDTSALSRVTTSGPESITNTEPHDLSQNGTAHSHDPPNIPLHLPPRLPPPCLWPNTLLNHRLPPPHLRLLHQLHQPNLGNPNNNLHAPFQPSHPLLPLRNHNLRPHHPRPPPDNRLLRPPLDQPTRHPAGLARKPILRLPSPPRSGCRLPGLAVFPPAQAPPPGTADVPTRRPGAGPEQ